MIRPQDWNTSGSLTLEPNAFKAASSTDGCIALMAGPGAGKTEMLAQRADFLLRSGTCPYPKRILAISFKKDASENLKERVSKRCGRELASRLDSYTFHAFAKRLIDIFRTHLKGADALDENYTIGDHRIRLSQITFADMVPLANEILKGCPSAKNSLVQTYSDVFLDEFQDCTDVQYELIKNAFLGSSARLVSVGDTKQTIMKWAGALEGIFIKFKNDFNAESLNLYQNFRSAPRIRRVHNEMVRVIDQDAAVPNDQLMGDDGIVSIHPFKDQTEEASWISSKIEDLLRDGVPLHEIAVLCKQQPHLYASEIMQELDSKGIPFRNEQEVQELFCEPIYRLIVDFIVILTGEREPDAWDRLFAMLSSEDRDREEGERSRKWSRFVQERKKQYQGDSSFATAWNLVGELLNEIDNSLLVGLSSDYSNVSRLNELVADTKGVVEPCFELSNVTASALKNLSEINAVRILTIHKCKGLEFDSVFIQGVERETYWGNLNESRCAYFVALSRAKKRLHVTFSGRRLRPEGYGGRWSVMRNTHQEFVGYLGNHLGGE